MSDEELHSLLSKITNWTGDVICNRKSLGSPAEDVCSLYPYMALHKAAENILESISHTTDGHKMVNLPTLIYVR